MKRDEMIGWLCLFVTCCIWSYVLINIAMSS